jgi:hypothetical protein
MVRSTHLVLQILRLPCMLGTVLSETCQELNMHAQYGRERAYVQNRDTNESRERYKVVKLLRMITETVRQFLATPPPSNFMKIRSVVLELLHAYKYGR